MRNWGINFEIGRRTGIELRERDLEILSVLEKWGVLGLAQLDGLVFRKGWMPAERVRLFFNATDRRMYTLACYKRLRDLELAGLIKAHPYLNHHKVFGLSDRGHRVLLERGRAKLLGFRRKMPEALLPHELTVNAVGLMIEQFLGLWVRPELERRIRSADPQERGKPVREAVSDLWIPDREHARPIEIELTKKAEFRYKELWQSFRAYPSGSQVLYIAGWPGGVEYLLKLTKKLETAGGWRIYVCGLKEFRDSLGRCAFANDTYPSRRFLSLGEPLSDSSPAASGGPFSADPAVPPSQRFRTRRPDALC